MRLQRKLTNKEWKEVEALGPGVHDFRGKRTLFYNGEILLDQDDAKERWSWKVIIVLPGVEVIPEDTFIGCGNIKTVIMADTVKRIEDRAFFNCVSLTSIRLSRNLEYIGVQAFCDCKSLTSIFIPPSCRKIDDLAFYTCYKLIIFNVPRHTELGRDVIAFTALLEAFPFEIDDQEIHDWVKNRHDDFPLHKICCSENPTFNQECTAEDCSEFWLY